MPTDKIQHHHLLIRAETVHCPAEEDKDKIKKFVAKLIDDIDMKALGEPHVYYVNTPKYNEGITAVTTIQTSHIAFHFWNTPNPATLHSDGTCLLQFDIYTCGKLTRKQIHHILHILTPFKPCHVDVTLLNRKYSLGVDLNEQWNKSESSWSSWISSL
jgi:S-adenosylmethionine/arginine decarboxylase-like enzyme